MPTLTKYVTEVKHKKTKVYFTALVLFFLFAFYVDREHLIINKKLDNFSWTESNFVTRFIKRKWQKIEITSENEVILHNIDSDFFPKWFSKIHFMPANQPNITHIISYAFKHKCTSGKKYPSGEVDIYGSKIMFICIDDNFIEYSFDGTSKKGLGIKIGKYGANFSIDEETKYLIQRTGKLNTSINQISCF